MAESAQDRVTIPGYEIEREIAAGGMGTIYLARQTKSGRLVAVKLLPASAANGDAQQASRFERETRLTAQLRHPNIVTFFDCGRALGRPYFVMDYVEGASLRELLQPDEPLPLPRIESIVQAVARALSYLHEQNVVHRDLKPENVLIDKFGHVRVVDFGIAAPLDDLGALTQSGQFVGTLDYMAPEQRHRLMVDARADQYSLAVMVYEMLTGKTPLGVFKPPSAHNHRLTPEVDAVVLQGLGNEPEDRFDTAAQFAAALQQALSKCERRPRKRLLAWGAAAALIFAAALLVIGSIGGRSFFDSFADADPPPHPPRFDRQIATPVRTDLSPPAASAAASPATGAGDNATTTASPASDQPPMATAPFLPDKAAQFRQAWAQHLGAAESFENSLEMKLVLIPPGRFVMGSSQQEVDALLADYDDHDMSQYWRDRLATEAPQREVTISTPFYLAAAETTIGQFRAFVDDTQYKTDAETRSGGFGRVGAQWQKGAQFNWRQTGQLHPADDWPVFNVSHNDAVLFCRWLSAREGRAYRLPTEAEWEYACRAGAAAPWSSGNDLEQLTEFARYDLSLNDTMSAVREKRCNPFGLFDMHGNLWEWCGDYQSADYDRSAATHDPAGPAEGKARILRGGAFYNNSGEVRSAMRNWASPTTRSYFIGFRVACDAYAKSPKPD